MSNVHLEQLRRAEIELVRDWFKPGMRVLEIGGGNGFQANILSSWGCEVHSIDLPSEATEQKRYYPVQDYDGKHIPVPSAGFDLVFSSNVLEHIQPVSDILAETHRILKSDGMAVHILPTPSWRFWTSLTHYLFLVKHLVLMMRGPRRKEQELPVRNTIRKRGLGLVIKRALFAGPHGEYPNALSELYFFSRNRWLELFQASGFDPVMVASNGLFYTGYDIFPSLPLTPRRRLARVLGSACHIFVLRKASPRQSFD